MAATKKKTTESETPEPEAAAEAPVESTPSGDLGDSPKAKPGRLIVPNENATGDLADNPKSKV